MDIGIATTKPVSGDLRLAASSNDPLEAATWKAMEAVPTFTNAPLKELLRPYFDKLTENLGVPQGTRLDAKTYLTVAKNYIRWIQSNRVVDALIEKTNAQGAQREAFEQSKSFLVAANAQLDVGLRDVGAFLRAMADGTERGFFQKALSKSNFDKFVAKTLTLAEVCRTQPELLFFFGT